MRRPVRLALLGVLVSAAAYIAAAYFLLPDWWTRYELGLSRQPDEMVTRTPQDIPGDPINVGFVGTRQDILHAMAAAGWNPADPVTLRSSIEIGLSVVLDRPYSDAPVSRLLFEGRPQDLAFEKPSGESADRRHHVRLWQTALRPENELPLWLGAASFDRGVGISHDTGQITHHIAPDIDAERDLLIADLEKICAVTSTMEIEGIGETEDGRNGGGDRYFTDGLVSVGFLAVDFRKGSACATATE
ncbi:MAG TPA: LssY C-terminal domain-containing protein [Rhizobiaceae bacterium]|nr:LssY C-terminal domain-containing protein [Rhizobiaceae bacterium]